MTNNIREGIEIVREVDVLLQEGKYIEAMDVFLTAYKEQQEYYNHQLQKARVQEKMRIKTLLEDLPAFTPCSDKTMGKVADEAKKPAYLTNYLERETVLKLLAE